ncbi:DUF6642 family protein [Candidatus Poriferisodalis sp.]|uniref:DUF6642 family protein n=1 Tax=Candidatus Poriferisodalis sp. TaxID=3101277 RepID=UPI003B520B1C
MAKDAAATAVTPTVGATRRLATGVFAFEGDDSDADLRQQFGVASLLYTVRELSGLKFIRRDIGRAGELYYYVRKWTQQRYRDYQVGHFGFHGKPGELWLSGSTKVTLDELAEVIDGRAGDRIIYFSSCEIMGTDDAALRRFRERTGASAVIGFLKRVGGSLELPAFELLLLQALSNDVKIANVEGRLRSQHPYLCDLLGLKIIR